LASCTSAKKCYLDDAFAQAACKVVAQTMNKKYGPSWNCIIGSSFASDVVFQKKTSLLLYYGGQFAIMLGKNPC
jgi:dynein light chain 4